MMTEFEVTIKQKQVGMRLWRLPGMPYAQVMEVLPEGPAAVGGIKPGDELMRINNRSVSGLEAEQASKTISTASRPMRLVFRRKNQTLTERLGRYIDDSLVASTYDLYHSFSDWRAEGADIEPMMYGKSSKLLLPILNPCTRAVLGCISAIESSDTVLVCAATASDGGSEAKAKMSSPAGTAEPTKIPLLSAMLDEIKATLSAAVAGLSFATARDLSIFALSSLRGVIKEESKDEKSVALCRSLVVAVTSDLHQRYQMEKEKRERATTNYKDGDDEGAGSAGVDRPDQVERDTSEVERLMLGGDALLGSPGAAADDDKIVFPDQNATSKLPYGEYKGLSSALEKCSREALLEAASNKKHRADIVLDYLKPYLDAWDKAQAAEAEESELVELFDSSLVEGFGDRSRGRRTKPIAASETAGDAIVHFAEKSSLEQSRLLEIQLVLSSQRSKKIAFADRNIFRCWLEVFCDQDEFENQWERSYADGGRDYGSRIATVPIAPQFKRYIPSWLDHTISLTEGDQLEGELKASEPDADFEFIEATKALGGVTIVDITTRQAEQPIIDADGDEVMDGELDPLAKHSEDADREARNHHNTEEEEAESDEESDEESGGFYDWNGKKSENTTSTTDSATLTETTEAGPSMTEGQQGKGQGDDTIAAADKRKSSKKKQQPGHELDKHHHRRGLAMSSFASPPDGSLAILGQIYSGESGISGVIEHFYQNALHVQQAGSRKCTLLLTSSHLILEYEEQGLYEEEAGHLQESRKRHLEEDELNPTAAIQKASSTVTDQDSNIEHEAHHTLESNPLFHAVEKQDETEDDKAAQFEKIERHSTSSAQQRPKTLRWNISELSHIYLRRYRLRDSALEMFLIPTAGELFGSVGLYSSLTSIFIDFGPGYEGNLKRDDAANAIMRRAPQQTVKQWPEKSGQFLHEQLRNVTRSWITRRLSNFEYLMSLNILAGRSFNDISQYPVFPWVLGGDSYSQEKIPDLEDPASFRDLSKPMGALNPQRLQEFKERFESFQDACVEIPPFMYGSHYSTAAGVVCYFLLRLHPFSQLHRQLQSGHFDTADRLFASVPRSWEMNTGPSAAEVKELTPEWYCNPSFLRNTNNFKLGSTQDGEQVGDVVLPPWADGSPEKFVEVMRLALESDVCSDMLPHWIDLIFGRKQQGPEAIEADNVFFYLTYYGSVDFSSIEDESVRQSLEDQVLHFGQCPMQLFWRPHVQKLPRQSIKMRSFDSYRFTEQSLSGKEGRALHQNFIDRSIRSIDASVGSIKPPPLSSKSKPFLSAPLSHWCHLASPPPGPHAPLIALRLAGSDRILSVDSQGVFHSFRWTWKAELEEEEAAPGPEDNEDISATEGGAVDNKQEPKTDPNEDLFIDKGCFVAQRDLPHFRSVPRLPYAPPEASNAKSIKTKGINLETSAAVAISKTLFASRTLMLVVSDGDGCGGLCLQLVTATGNVKTETIIPQVHAARISAIAMDPIGNAAGQGGVGGEVTMVGSADGSATLWRFISSQFLPLRPRLRLGGHSGAPIHAVTVSSPLNLCASISRERCCIFNVSNGALVRSFAPPTRKADGKKLVFAECPALCLSQQGYIAVVCECLNGPDSRKKSISIELFTLEGIHIGSKDMAWRGLPHKMIPITGGKAMMVCGGRGVTVHRISSLQPLDIIDDWRISLNDASSGARGVTDGAVAAYDVDFGPSLVRPVVAAAACSSGALRLHALRGISQWSEEHKKGAVSAAAHALARPAQRLRNVVGGVKGIGSRFLGVGKEISKEAVDEIKERGGLFGFRGGGRR